MPGRQGKQIWEWDRPHAGDGWFGERVASVWRERSDGVASVLFPCTSLIYPLYNPCTTLIHGLFYRCPDLLFP